MPKAGWLARSLLLAAAHALELGARLRIEAVFDRPCAAEAAARSRRSSCMNSCEERLSTWRPLVSRTVRSEETRQTRSRSRSSAARRSSTKSASAAKRTSSGPSVCVSALAVEDDDASGPLQATKPASLSSSSRGLVEAARVQEVEAVEEVEGRLGRARAGALTPALGRVTRDGARILLLPSHCAGAWPRRGGGRPPRRRSATRPRRQAGSPARRRSAGARAGAAPSSRRRRRAPRRRRDRPASTTFSRVPSAA